MAQIIHFGLAALIYISTIGVSVHQHFCQDELKNIAFWQTAESCHSSDKICPATGKVCKMHANPDCDKDCCDDEVSLEQADWEYVPEVSSFSLDLDIVAIPALLNQKEFHLSRIQSKLPQKYRPPPRYFTSQHIMFSIFLC